jgi:adenylate cyclase
VHTLHIQVLVYGRDVWIASQLQSASAKLLENEQNGIFVTDAVCNALLGTQSDNRLQPVTLQPVRAAFKNRGLSPVQ